MSSFCRNCGAQLAAIAKFCAGCGATTGAAPAAPPPMAPPPAAPQYVAPPPYYPPASQPNVWPWIAGALALLIVVAGAVYFATRPSDPAATAANATTPAVVPPVAGSGATPAVAQPSVPIGPRVTLYVTSPTNVRSEPTALGTSQVLRTLTQGTQVTGNMQIGSNGKARWFKLADNTGYVSAINLSNSAVGAPVVASATPSSIPGATYCTVVDRNGTNLRIRSSPGGAVLGGMPHGVRIRVLEYTNSAMDGMDWVRVDPDGRYPTGWVARAHISC